MGWEAQAAGVGPCRPRKAPRRRRCGLLPVPRRASGRPRPPVAIALLLSNSPAREAFAFSGISLPGIPQKRASDRLSAKTTGIQACIDVARADPRPCCPCAGSLTARLAFQLLPYQSIPRNALATAAAPKERASQAASGLTAPRPKRPSARYACKSFQECALSLQSNRRQRATQSTF